MIKLALEHGDVINALNAAKRHRELSDVFDPVKNNSPLAAPHNITGQAAGKLVFLPEAGIFFVLRHARSNPET